MDAFVNTVQQPENKEIKKAQDLNNLLPTVVDTTCELSTKEKQVTESKPDIEIEKVTTVQQTVDDKKLLTNTEHVNDICTATTAQMPEIVPVENHKDKITSTMTIEDSNKTVVQTDNKRTNDVVDHANIVDKNVLADIEARVAQKNEENTKVSIIVDSSNDDKNIDNTSDNKTQDEIVTPTVPAGLKYTYREDQWSPTNTSGKKIYDVEFLMKLKNDPQCRIKPQNLPNLDIVQKTSSIRICKDPRSVDTLYPGFAKPPMNMKVIQQQLPGNKKSYQGNKKTNKPNVIHVSLSLHEDVKLRESENAWKPTRVKSDVENEETVKTEALYKKVRSVLNKLTPQKFDTLVNQVKALEIDTFERLQGVIDLVFEKAVDEPNFSVAYALMCKQLAQMQVAGGDKSSANETKQEKDIRKTFRILILSRCQSQFEANTTVDEGAKNLKLKEINDCTDPEKKKELMAQFQDAERRLRMKSVGNIRFIGELFKQGMLKPAIMDSCISHLLKEPTDEENLECLCKLLTTIGKTFESSGAKLGDYFTKMSQLSQQKTGDKKISSRVRFMLQDVIDLRATNWKPRRDEGNPKTMDQVVKDAESERLDIELNNTPINTPRKDDRNSDRRRNRGGNPNNEDGWSVMSSKSARMPYAVETSKLHTKEVPMDEVKLGGRSQFQWGHAAMAKPQPQQQQNKYALLDLPSESDKRSIQLSGSKSTGSTRDFRPEYKSWEGGRGGSRNGSYQLHSSSSMSGRDSRESLMPETVSRSQSMSMPPPSMKYDKRPAPPTPVSTKPVLTETQLKNEIHSVIDGCKTCANADAFILSAMDQLSDKLHSSLHSFFLNESLNVIFEKSSSDRNRFSALLAHMINNKIFSLSLFQSEYDEILKIADDLVIDLPKFWIYAAEIIAPMVVRDAHPLSELKRTTSVLKPKSSVGKLVGEIFTLLAQSESPKWVSEKWEKSGLQWSDLIDPSLENADDIIKKHGLDYLTKGNTTDKLASSVDLTEQKLHDQLVKLLREGIFDNTTSWITANVGNVKTKVPSFMRTLVTAILDVTTTRIITDSPEPFYKLDSLQFESLLPLVHRYADAKPELELQALYAINAYNHKLEHPQGYLSSIIEKVCDVLSDDAFIAWQESTDPAEMPGHGVAIRNLTSFFVKLKEAAVSESSEDDCKDKPSIKESVVNHPH